LYRTFGKRLIDLSVSTLALIGLAPVLAVLALRVRRKLGTPVLFRQERPGLHGRPFTLLKFRTMTDARGSDGRLLPDAERLTPFGRSLRASSLDELPELFNVLRGEMSLVGPRPLLIRYLDRYSTRQARRHEVRPGITGWAQVGGRNALGWDERLERDVWYVDHLGPALDFEILARTVVQVFRRVGISAEGHATMPEFQGSER
jgi:lipopolysaccharide/colanic/teichoic acid biosynthesis glycosyltransferase